MPRSPAPVLAVRSDSLGDVLLAGPAIRDLAASGRPVVALVSGRGEPAARLLPGVTAVERFDVPWIDADPAPVDPGAITDAVRRIAAVGATEAVVFTSFHQDPLPMALLLRLAGVGRIGAVCEDYPGSLLDVRHRVPEGLHEVERGRSLARACGFGPAPGDDERLAIRLDRPPARRDHVVVHPGASVGARTWSPPRWAALVLELTRRGRRVVVTGSPGESALVRAVAGTAAPGPGRAGVAVHIGEDLAGLAGVLGAAAVVAVGNTGPAHLAAAVGTPVVSVFPPTVPAVRWRPWGVDHELFGDQRITCAGCRARTCPRTDRPLACVDDVPVPAVADAVERLAAGTGPIGRVQVALPRPAAVSGPGR